MKTLKISSLIIMILSFYSCKEKPSLPVLSTSAVSQITTESAVSGGSISNDGGASIISKGICWSTSVNPTTESRTNIEAGEANTFTSNITGLSPKTQYYVRAYATNSEGTSYGESLPFTTLGNTPVTVVSDATNIAIDSAILNGTINPNSLSTTVSFEWGTTINYGITHNAIQSPISGNASTYVTIKLTNLIPGTTYHYRLKAENSLGTTYSSDMTFTTLGQTPVASVQNVSNIHVNTVTLNGSVNPNLLPTTVYFEWGFTTNYGNIIPYIPNSINGSSPLNISTNLSGLNPETIYHFRIKATNILGTSYSNDGSFMTYAVSDADNNLYHSVTIGTQTWMKENLKTTHFNDNTNIPIITGDWDWDHLTTPACCWYNNNESTYKNDYGALYNWYSVNTGKLCPSGWHVPSDLEWQALINYLGGGSVAGTKLKESGTEHWWTPNPNATNVSGFTARPAGNRGTNGVFGNIYLDAYFWHSTEYTSSAGQITYIQYLPNAYIDPYNKYYGASVRCIKD